MVQVFEGAQQPSLGQLLGQGMGQGMQQKLEQMRQSQGLSQVLGLDESQAKDFARMSPQIQQAIAGPMIKQKMQEKESENVLKMVEKYKEAQRKGTTSPGYFKGQPDIQPEGALPEQDVGQATKTSKFVPPNDPNLIAALKAHPNKSYQGMGDALTEENKMAMKEWQTEKTEEKQKIKFQYESPYIRSYLEGLEKKETAASEILPEIENARKYRNDPSRFISGTAANKTLQNLSMQAFSYYKPMFGGRLTQKEFAEGMKAVSMDRTFPGGFDAALNLIERMSKKAINESELFNSYVESGMSPMKAKKKAQIDVINQRKEVAKEAVKVLKNPNELKKQQGFQTFKIKGTSYNIPNEQVEEFKKEMGIK